MIGNREEDFVLCWDGKEIWEWEGDRRGEDGEVNRITAICACTVSPNEHNYVLKAYTNEKQILKRI